MKTNEGLAQFGKLWDQALVSNDVDEIGKFMSFDWVLIGTEGGVTSKSSFLKWISSGDLIHTRMDFEDIRVQVYENSGVATSKGISGGTYKGQPFSFYEWSTSMYIWKEKKWSCVLTMLTPAKK